LERAAYHLAFDHPKVIGQEVECFVGHCIHILGLRHSMLSCLGSLYVFIRKSYRKRQPLWASTRKEARWIWSLLPLCVVDCDAEWSNCVHCYDASLSGFGVVASRWPLEQVTRHGRLRERARFRGLLSKTTSDGDGDSLMSVAGRCRGDAFLECPRSDGRV
jgi:hypothetical protein